MTIVQCPRCRDEVTVPAKASPQALVRCPLCLEEYLLREALADLPPTLLVIDGSVTDDEPALVGAGAAEASGDYRLSGGSYGGMLDSSPAAGATVAPARQVVKGAPRPKRKEKNAITEGVKIILGGLVGISLAPIVLWWVFGNDALDLGPKVSPYVPWIVPAKFRGTPAPKGTETVNAPGANQNTPAAANNNPNTPGGNNQPGAGNPGGNSGEVELAGNLDPQPELTSDPLVAAPTEPSLTEIPFEAVPTVTPPAATVRSTPEPVALDPDAINPKPEPAPTPTPEPTPVKSGATAEDLQQAVLAAAGALAKVNETTTGTREERQLRFTDMFQAGSELGRVATQLDTADPALAGSAGAMQTFLGSLAATAGKISGVKFLAAKHYPERKHGEGILLAGIVKDIQTRGGAFELTLDGGKGLETLPIVSAANPMDFCQVGDELVLVGRIVEEPQKHLPIYEGEQTRVVLLGSAVSAPKM